MKTILNWTPWVLIAFALIKQDTLYNKTIWEIKVNGYNIWEINLLLPVIFSFIIAFISYILLILFFNKKKLLKRYFKTSIIGILVLLSCLSTFLPLYINYTFASLKLRKTEFKITKHKMIGRGKYTNDGPAIFISLGFPNKRLTLFDFSQEEVFSKTIAVLTLREGYLGWDIIEKVELK